MTNKTKRCLDLLRELVNEMESIAELEEISGILHELSKLIDEIISQG